MLIALATATGIQGTYYLAVSQAVLQTHVPAHLISRVGFYTLLGAIVIPISLAGAGPLADQWGSRTLLTAAAAWVVISTLAILAVHDVASLPARESSADRA